MDDDEREETEKRLDKCLDDFVPSCEAVRLIMVNAELEFMKFRDAIEEGLVERGFEGMKLEDTLHKGTYLAAFNKGVDYSVQFTDAAVRFSEGLKKELAIALADRQTAWKTARFWKDQARKNL